jgi:hypothetical protein
MERKLRSKAGQAIYALRKTVVELVFGQIKRPEVSIVSCCEGWRR